MARRIEVLSAIERSGILPIFYHADHEVAVGALRAAASGGASVFEFTNRGAGALDVFAALVQTCRKELPGMLLGAGSIVDAPTAALYLDRGAAFIVAPCFNAEVAKLCNRRKVAYIPGCATATEVSHAEELGCEFVKLFPAKQLGGPAFLNALRGPMPWVSAVVTGGIEVKAEELNEWFGAGAVAVGLGSHLFPSRALEAKDFSQITKRTKEALQIVSQCRTRA